MRFLPVLRTLARLGTDVTGRRLNCPARIGLYPTAITSPLDVTWARCRSSTDCTTNIAWLGRPHDTESSTRIVFAEDNHHSGNSPIFHLRFVPALAAVCARLLPGNGKKMAVLIASRAGLRWARYAGTVPPRFWRGDNLRSHVSRAPRDARPPMPNLRGSRASILASMINFARALLVILGVSLSARPRRRKRRPPTTSGR